MTNYKRIEEIAKYAQEKYGEDYGVIGVRIQKETFGLTVGDIMDHDSSVWDDGEITEETIGGVCAINSTYRFGKWNHGGYAGETILILGADYGTGGNDPGEIIMKNAEVLEIIQD